jgi:putative peptide zinc metalloprotease protein
MESKIIVKNPDAILKPLDSSSVLNSYVIQIEDRFYKLDENLAQILLFIDKGKSLIELNEFINELYKANIPIEKVIEFVEKKLIIHNFAYFKNQNETQTVFPKTQRNAYIKFKFALFKFESLKNIIKKLTFLFNPYVFSILNIISLIILITIIIVYIEKNISERYFSSIDYLIILLILYIGNLWHEFGHVTACYNYGVKPKNIGFGIYIFFPVLYSDVTNVWLLSRKKRIIVNYAGIYFQLIYISFLYLIYLGEGSVIILKSLYLIIISFIPTLNPILRFDGYWIFSDLIGVDNLRSNSNRIIEYYKNNFLKRKAIKPDVFSQYSTNTLSFLKLYMVFSILFLCFFYYIIARELGFIIREVGLYFLNLYKTNFTEFYFNMEFVNIVIKLIIVSVVLYFLLNRILKK